MSQKGFTLVEILVCLIIFSVGFLSVGAMQITSVKNGCFSANVTKATLLAKSKLEYLKNLPANSAELAVGTQNSVVPGTIFSLCRVVADQSGNLELTVSVRWTELTGHSVTLRTLRAKT